MRPRHRVTTALGLTASAALLLTACATAEPEAPASDAPSQTSAPATSSASPSTSSAAPSSSASATTSETSGEDASQTYTTESGSITWTYPGSWTAEQTDYNEDSVEYVGVPYEVVEFQGGSEGLSFQATTGVGATDGDGPKPTIVDVLDAEELPEVPVLEGDSGYGTGPVWYRATILQDTGEMGEQGFFDGDEFHLNVQVVNVPAGTDPETTDEDHWAGWVYAQPVDSPEGAAAFLNGSIDQSTAEELTGLEGEEAMRAVLETEEYAQLRDLATSMEVTAP